MSNKIFENKSLEHLIDVGKNQFQELFKYKPLVASFAPGRVNLIGEHTDYNDGFVLPMSIPRYTVIVGAPKSNDNNCHIITLNELSESNNNFIFDKNDSSIDKTCKWINYVKGVLAFFPEQVKAFDAVIVSSVPIGQGLSSSASLESATFVFLEALCKLEGKILNLNKEDKAKICQKAEHKYANVPCGIMDQFVSFFAKENSILLIDCKNLNVELISANQLKEDGYLILVINSNIQHDLANSEYYKRKRTCEHVANLLGKSSLRDVSMKELETSFKTLPLESYQNCRHVITEIERTVCAAEALKKRDYNVFGVLMLQSHLSLKNDLKTSCPEIDEIVDFSMECEGVFGSKITGGGFGGCIVSLVKQDQLENIKRHISNKITYNQKLEFYTFLPVDGANYLELNAIN